MMSMAAIAFASVFTSCSKEKDLMDQNAIDNQIVLNYQQAFQKVFGTPIKGHTWGFGDNVTRAEIDVNGNLWESCPELGDNEESDVVAYVQSLATKPNTNPIQLQNYYVTQVHCGTEVYTNAGGGAGIKGSAHMDHLQIAMTSDATITDGALSEGWQHINNFNRGDNTDWKGNTLVTSGGTFDFAYNGSEDSKYHNRWIAIDGKDVPKTGGGNYAGNYYVCFDFEATIPGITVFSNIEFYDPVTKQWKNTSSINIPGNWTSETLLASDLTLDLPAESHYDPEATNEWGGKGATVVDRYVTVHFKNRDEVRAATFSNVLGDNMIINPNSSYLDWIVRLVKAEPKDGEKTADLRVMAEDLSASDDSDFDFNDVVFDVFFSPNEGEAYVMVQAAGGTLPLKINGTEVHNLFGQPEGIMINTNATAKGLPGVENQPAQKIQLTGITVNSKQDANEKIHIVVTKQVKDAATGELVSKDFELVNSGEAACKIAVNPTSIKNWADERTSINSIVNMNKWVTEGGELEPTYPNAE